MFSKLINRCYQYCKQNPNNNNNVASRCAIDSLPTEIVVQIFYQFSLRQLIQLEMVCRTWKNLIRQYPWFHFDVYMFRVPESYMSDHPKNYLQVIEILLGHNNIQYYDIKLVKHLLFNYHFQKIYLRGSHIDETVIERLSQLSCQAISITNCKILTDSELSKFIWLPKCRYVNLSGCPITDNTLPFLKDCYKVVLNHCRLITDKGLVHLAKCQYIYLGGCSQITDDGVKYLDKCQYLNIRSCQVSTEMVVHLRKNVKKLVCTRVEKNRRIRRR